MSLPVLDSSAALMKLCEMDYGIGTGYFIKVLIGKRYALPTQALNAVVEFFKRFYNEEEEQLPVIWHQALLLFVQQYKYSFTQDQVKDLKKLYKKHQHHAITPELRKELALDSLGSGMVVE